MAGLGSPSMTGIAREDGRPVRSAPRVPALDDGDRLTRDEFERRYAARPDIHKAELIEGVVHVSSPVRLTAHAEPHAVIQGILLYYTAFTPSVGVAGNATVRLDLDNEPQPDVLLRLDEAVGGRSRVSDDGYLEGAPELVVEVSASSASIDLQEKFRVYRRNGVREYIVWRTREERIDWFELADGEYRPLPQDDAGVIGSRVFPGLRLAVRALLAGNVAGALAEVDKGLRSPEHRRFIARPTSGNQ